MIPVTYYRLVSDIRQIRPAPTATSVKVNALVLAEGGASPAHAHDDTVALETVTGQIVRNRQSVLADGPRIEKALLEIVALAPQQNVTVVKVTSKSPSN